MRALKDVAHIFAKAAQVPPHACEGKAGERYCIRILVLAILLLAE